jgi:hypothetical protein
MNTRITQITAESNPNVWAMLQPPISDTRPERHADDAPATDEVLHDMAVEDAMDEFDA